MEGCGAPCRSSGRWQMVRTALVWRWPLVPTVGAREGGCWRSVVVWGRQCVCSPRPVFLLSFPLLQLGSEVYHHLKSIIKKKYGVDAVNVGDEGGFAPSFQVRGCWPGVAVGGAWGAGDGWARGRRRALPSGRHIISSALHGRGGCQSTIQPVLIDSAHLAFSSPLLLPPCTPPACLAPTAIQRGGPGSHRPPSPCSLARRLPCPRPPAP